MICNMRPIFFPSAILLAMTAGSAACQEITVAWRDKPPYHYVEDGVEKGMLLLRTRQVFASAGIPARFVREPSKRIWANFQSGMQNYCSIGWYRLPEREALVQFSVALHVDPPHAVLVAPGAVAAVGAHATLVSLLSDATLTLGVIDGVSYGPRIDALIYASANQVLRRTVEPVTMMRMTAAGRVSFMLIDRDDWQYAQEREPSLRFTVRRDFPDMPPGLQRHLVCSKDVSPAVMQKLNRAIEAGGGRAAAAPSRSPQ